MTARISMKSALWPTKYNRGQWDTLDPKTLSSQSLFGQPTRESITSLETSVVSLSSAGKASKVEKSTLQRLRSTKPSKRLQRLRVRAYRSEMAKSNSQVRIAWQIRLLREKAGLSQSELAKKLGTRQSAIARLEDTEYGRHSIAMLHRIADYFDVATWIEFVPFSTLLRRTTDLSPSAITPLHYDEEFDETGELTITAHPQLDGSLICSSNYFTKIPLPQQNSWSRVASTSTARSQKIQEDYDPTL